MAKAITQIERFTVDPDDVRIQDKEALITALLERKQSMEALIELVEHLDDRGILDLLNGLLGKGDEVLAIAMKELNKPSLSDTLDHFMNLAALVSRLETKKLVDLAGHINHGMATAEKMVASGAKTSLFDLLSALKDPDVNRAITAMIGFLKGVGSHHPEE
ncbi:DUF1641 domain-containing protein [Camelliibacillus cellulosilyticus]|uniref:DUF1641 domain-containing protein n=1 Tax=Camelliibacillus cellulosilyticus TaxID=2174486 RepID=A0ABV9GQC6_9BACL